VKLKTHSEEEKRKLLTEHMTELVSRLTQNVKFDGIKHIIYVDVKKGKNLNYLAKANYVDTDMKSAGVEDGDFVAYITDGKKQYLYGCGKNQAAAIKDLKGLLKMGIKSWSEVS